MAILIGNADLSAIWTPFHVSYGGDLAVVDHLVHPFPIVFHKYNDQPIAVAGGQLPIFVVPVDFQNVTIVVVEIGVFSWSPATLLLPWVL